MSSLAYDRMSLDAFLDWDDGTDARHELLDGIVHLMAPPGVAHAAIVTNLAIDIGSHAERTTPCRLLSGAGVRLPHRADSFYVPDLVLTCMPVEPGHQYAKDPALIVEVLSPSTAEWDRDVKLPDYQAIPSVREILIVSTRARRVELWQRRDEGWIGLNVITNGTVHLGSVDLTLPLDQVYRNTTVGNPDTVAAAAGAAPPVI